MSNIRKIDGTDGPVRAKYGVRDLAHDLWAVIEEKTEGMDWGEIAAGIEAIRFQAMTQFQEDLWEQ